MKKKYSKKDMTLITLFKMSEGKMETIHYEDLLVNTFRSYKKEFQLKRYPEYPDSDVFRYIVYFQLKPAGLIRIVQKQCMLTELGIKESKKLLGTISNKHEQDKFKINNEIKRLLSLTGFVLFQEDEDNKIIDQDFFDFYKSSVRTKPLELLGNINRVNDAIKEYFKMDKVVGSKLFTYSEFLKKHFIHLYEGVKHESNN